MYHGFDPCRTISYFTAVEAGRTLIRRPTVPFPATSPIPSPQYHSQAFSSIPSPASTIPSPPKPFPGLQSHSQPPSLLFPVPLAHCQALSTKDLNECHVMIDLKEWLGVLPVVTTGVMKKTGYQQLRVVGDDVSPQTITKLTQGVQQLRKVLLPEVDR